MPVQLSRRAPRESRISQKETVKAAAAIVGPPSNVANPSIGAYIAAIPIVIVSMYVAWTEIISHHGSN